MSLTGEAEKMDDQRQAGRDKNFRFWIMVFLVICLLGGLGAYIVSNDIPISIFGRGQSVSPSETSQPVLSLGKSQSATIKQGQTLILHGEHFGTNDTITFLLDFITPIKDENGKIIFVQASRTGAFDELIPVQRSGWSADSHFIQAVDNKTNKIAYVNIVVSPASST